MPKRHEARQRLREDREERKVEGKPRHSHSAKLALHAEETAEILRRSGYNSPLDGDWVDLTAQLHKSIDASSFHPEEEAVPAPADSRPTERIVFECATAFGAACSRLQLLEDGEQPEGRPLPKICVLNFASAKRPGGGWRTGAAAQEEELTRASGLYPTLTRHTGMYGDCQAGLYSDRMVYSPGVPVFRDDYGQLLHEPFLCDVISAAACNMNGLKSEDRGRLDETMRRRARRVVELARAKGVDTLVLGAWGTGVFGLDPDKVAFWFREALTGVHFDEVVFAFRDPQKMVVFQAVFAEAKTE